jgi:hypothetical protein
MRLAFCLLMMLVAHVTPAQAQDPAPAQPTIEQLLTKLTELRKQRADIEKQEAAVAAEIRARVKELTEKLAKLGLIDPLPNPVPPAPTDPLKQKLKGAFDSAAGTGQQKGEWAKDLAALYRAAAKLTADPSITTAAALKLKLKEAAASLIGETALVEVRKVVAVELANVLPTTETELTEVQRKAAAELFAKLASLLDAIAME